uniref:Uncharacterized protein n=1 Tax=Arundo donax TaxID=35708 RepID=A0A0A9FBJ2_ARUDO
MKTTISDLFNGWDPELNQKEIVVIRTTGMPCERYLQQQQQSL